MQKTKLIGAMILAMGMAGSVFAGNGFYAGASVGQSSADVCGDLLAVGATGCDDNDTGWKLFGGYNLSENFAVEGAWVDLGEVSASVGATALGVELDGFVIDAKATLPINDQFGIFGKLGFIMWNADGTGAASGTDDDGTDFAFGLGAQYMLTDQFGLVGEWERFDLDGDDVDLLSIGAMMKF